MSMREWWFTFGSGALIGCAAHWAWSRIRAELVRLDRRYEAARAAHGDDLDHPPWLNR